MSASLVENSLFVYTSNDFESLKDILKCIDYAYNDFEYNKYENLEFNSFSMTFEKEDSFYLFSFDYKDGVCKIGLRTCEIDTNDNVYSSKLLYFNLLQNEYVHKNLNQTVAVWINLVLKHKQVQYCDNVLGEYI